MKTIKAPFAARAPTWLGRVERRKRLSRYVEASSNESCDWVRATENAPRSPFHILERRHGLAEIVERGVVVPVERRRVTQSHLERVLMTLPENAPRHGDRLSKQWLGFCEAS